MSFEIDDNKSPGAATVYITARWGNSTFTGSGFLVGPNDVVTAAHVIFDLVLGGVAEEIRIYPSYDPDEAPGESYAPRFIQYFPDFDPDGDGRLITGDFNRPTYAGSEIDIALLSLAEPAGERFGWYGIDWNFQGGSVGVIGYPGIYGRQPMFDSGSVRRSPVDGVFLINSDLEVNPGNSGGPVYYDYGSGAFAVAVVSTGLAATSLGAHASWLKDAITENDRFLAPRRFDGTAGADRISGSERRDEIYGFGGDDALAGLGGDDSLYGGLGSDTLDGGAGADLLDGGGGFDFVAYRAATAGAGARLDGGVNWGAASGDAIRGVEALIGSDFADTLVGSEAGNVLIGGRGADRLFGGGGGDLLSPGDRDGADLVDGGAGFDRLDFAAAGVGVGVRLDGGANWGGAAGDVYRAVEAVSGSPFGDVLIGSAVGNVLDGGGGDDRLFGLAGADRLNGGAGSDRLEGGAGGDILDGGFGFARASYAAEAGFVGARLDGGANWGAAAGDAYVSIEGLVGTRFGDVLVGNASANTLEGGRGSDQLFGLGGADRFVFAGPGFGNDVVRDFQNGVDRLDFTGHAGVRSLADLAISPSGTNVRIGAGADAVFLVGLGVEAIDASDFLFS